MMATARHVKPITDMNSVSRSVMPRHGVLKNRRPTTSTVMKDAMHSSSTEAMAGMKLQKRLNIYSTLHKDGNSPIPFSGTTLYCSSQSSGAASRHS